MVKKEQYISTQKNHYVVGYENRLKNFKVIKSFSNYKFALEFSQSLDLDLFENDIAIYNIKKVKNIR